MKIKIHLHFPQISTQFIAITKQHWQSVSSMQRNILSGGYFFSLRKTLMVEQKVIAKGGEQREEKNK